MRVARASGSGATPAGKWSARWGAGLLAPLALGALADRISLERAFGAIGLLILVAIVATLLANRVDRATG